MLRFYIKNSNHCCLEHLNSIITTYIDYCPKVHITHLYIEIQKYLRKNVHLSIQVIFTVKRLHLNKYNVVQKEIFNIVQKQSSNIKYNSMNAIQLISPKFIKY